jgi:hypothetical protein
MATEPLNPQHFMSWARDQAFSTTMKEMRAMGIRGSDRIALLYLSPEMHSRITIDGKPLREIMPVKPVGPTPHVAEHDPIVRRPTSPAAGMLDALKAKGGAI